MKQQNKIIAVILSVFLFLNFSLFAQVAGEIPTGGSIEVPNIDLRLYENYSDTITYLDIDLDGFVDLKITLFKGYPPFDASNLVLFETPDNKFAFCVDSMSSLTTIHYNLNDPLCIGISEWGIDSVYSAGCYAGWTCSHDTSSVNNKFIAYKNNITGDVGWFKFSMKLYSQTEPTFVSFKISEMLVFNLESGLGNASNDFHFKISPNPFSNNYFSISSNKTLSMVEIYDLSGNRRANFKSDFDKILFPESNGVYIIKVYDEDGNSLTEKLLKL